MVDQATLLVLVGITASLFGSGWVVKILWGALIGALDARYKDPEVLREAFFTRDEAQGLGERLTGVQNVAMNSSQVAEQALAKAESVAKDSEVRWERTLETLERVSHSMEEVMQEMKAFQREQAAISKDQAVMARDIKSLFRTIDARS